MSAAADHLRDDRRRWARPGSAHDALVRTMRLLLPAGVGAVMAWLLLAPFARGSSEIGFLLDKNRVEVAPQRLRVEAARYTGTDVDGRRFTLTAADAVQKSAADPIVRLTDMTAAMEDKYREMAVEAIPLGRTGKPEDVAAVVSFLASDDSAYVSGAVLPVDGGLGMGH